MSTCPPLSKEDVGLSLPALEAAALEEDEGDEEEDEDESDEESESETESSSCSSSSSDSEDESEEDVDVDQVSLAVKKLDLTAATTTTPQRAIVGIEEVSEITEKDDNREGQQEDLSAQLGSLSIGPTAAALDKDKGLPSVPSTTGRAREILDAPAGSIAPSPSLLLLDKKEEEGREESKANPVQPEKGSKKVVLIEEL